MYSETSTGYDSFKYISGIQVSKPSIHIPRNLHNAVEFLIRIFSVQVKSHLSYFYTDVSPSFLLSTIYYSNDVLNPYESIYARMFSEITFDVYSLTWPYGMSLYLIYDQVKYILVIVCRHCHSFWSK